MVTVFILSTVLCPGSCKINFTFANDCSLPFVLAQISKVWYSKAELSENRWFQVDQKIVDLKVYSKLSQQGNNLAVIITTLKSTEFACEGIVPSYSISLEYLCVSQ